MPVRRAFDTSLCISASRAYPWERPGPRSSDTGRATRLDSHPPRCQNRGVNTTAPPPPAGDGEDRPADLHQVEPEADRPLAERGEILRAAFGLAFYAAAFGISFGAVSVASGLSVAQTMVLSLVLFSGASQFAFVGVVASGSPFAAIPAALLLGVRTTFYAVTIAQILRPRRWMRLLAVHFSFAEYPAIATARRTSRVKTDAFWASGVAMFTLWNMGSAAGAVLGSVLDNTAFGLDAAAPAAFLALLWPALATP